MIVCLFDLTPLVPLIYTDNTEKLIIRPLVPKTVILKREYFDRRDWFRFGRFKNGTHKENNDFTRI